MSRFTDALNEQIAYEFGASQQYVAIAVHYDAQTLPQLAAKVKDDAIVLVDKLEFAEPKTRDMAAILKTLGCVGETVLVATSEYNQNIYKSVRNIAKVSVAPAGDLNALSVLSAKRLLMTTAAADALKAKVPAGKNGAKKDGE